MQGFEPLLFYTMDAMQNNALSVFAYQGKQITFKKGDSVMVNATEMAKPFGKRPIDWLKYQQSQEYINALSEVRNITSADLVRVMKGGNDKNAQGTWFHEDVALEFARWLSPAFAIWCNDRIKELLLQGVTTVSEDDATILHAFQLLQKRVEAQTKRAEALEAKIEEDAPVLAYANEVLSSTSSYTLTQMAHDLGLRSVYVLTDFLKGKGYISRASGNWEPTAKVADKGYFFFRTCKYVKSDDTVGTKLYLSVTESGRRWLHGLLKKEKACV